MDEHVPLLDDAAVAAIRRKRWSARRTESARKWNAPRKSATQKAKEEAELRKQGITPYLGRTAWWESQRAKLTETQRSELAAREQQVLDMEHWAKANWPGPYCCHPRREPTFMSASTKAAT